MASRRHPPGVSVSPAPDFAQFYAATWPRLLRTTYAVAGDRQRAEDALQTAFAQAYASWGRVSRAQDPLAYVRKMAVNAALAQHRRAFTRRECGGEPPERAVPPADDAVLARDEVWLAVRALPPRQRAIVVLRYYEDLSERQIADVLRCRPGTVKSQAAAALASLRARLGEAAATSEEERA
jgi:RNA polymerase sigma-70 factor (sigma-E family)